MSLIKRIPLLFSSRRRAIFLFCMLVVSSFLAAFWKGDRGRDIPLEPPVVTTRSNDGVELKTSLSQAKMVRGANGEIYLQVGVKTPKGDSATTKQASDVILVLDRSGSMNGAKKFPYAQMAIRQLANNLDENDRFALISFSNHARIDIPMIHVDERGRREIFQKVNGIYPGGGTNLSHGLQVAESLFGRGVEKRSRRVLLLSDGQANQGITDPKGLSELVKKLTNKNTVVSTIGLGLGFNEKLMATLSNHGMGQFHFLENPRGLEKIFNDDLGQARALFAAQSELHLELGDHFTLVDAGAYPIEKTEAGLRIKTGQLLQDHKRSLILSLRVNANEIENLDIGKVKLRYQNDGKWFEVANEGELQLAVVAPEKRHEVLASFDKLVMKNSWAFNNVGRLQREVSELVQKGEKKKALKKYQDYRTKMKEVKKDHGADVITKESEDDARLMEAQINAAFEGSAAEQSVKRNRAAKSMLNSSRYQQRSRY